MSSSFIYPTSPPLRPRGEREILYQIASQQRSLRLPVIHCLPSTTRLTIYLDSRLHFLSFVPHRNCFTQVMMHI